MRQQQTMARRGTLDGWVVGARALDAAYGQGAAHGGLDGAIGGVPPVDEGGVVRVRGRQKELAAAVFLDYVLSYGGGFSEDERFGPAVVFENGGGAELAQCFDGWW